MNVPPTTPIPRSRFRTAEHEPLTWRQWLELPPAITYWILLKLTGRRAKLPWIPASARREIARLLPANARVLEVGAGMSTLWLAPRCAQIISFESDQGWCDVLQAELTRRKLDHVDLQHRWLAHEMADFSLVPDDSLDLCVIDGGPRHECARAAPPKIKPGGCIYLDNADTNLDAKRLLLELANDGGWSVSIHRGFPPACLYVTEGIVVRRHR